MQDSLFSRPQPPSPPIEPVQGVSRVVDYIRRILENNKTLATLRVRGEVSDLRERNGRLYFDLKEGADVLKCLVWASTASKLPLFKNGEEIICDGDFSTYSPHSVYQLIVKSVEQTGIGVLYAQFEALKEKFRKEGLFENDRKRALPALPRRIAVVSSPGGRGVEDFFTTLAREAPFIDVVPVETRVEGDGAEIDISEAIDKASRLDVDVIVVTRGGGSYESLFAFNREPVVRAIVRAKHPVISAVGHTQDVHLSDFVADQTCETPSNAAHYFAQIGKRYLSLLQRARAELEFAMRRMLVDRAQRFDESSGRLKGAMENCMRASERRLHQLEKRLGQQTPQQRLAQRGERIASLRSRVDVLARHALRPSVERLMRATQRLSSMRSNVLQPSWQRLVVLQAQLGGTNPEQLLERGYAIVTYDGKAVRDAGTVPRGALIEARLQRGKLEARVERTQSND